MANDTAGSHRIRKAVFDFRYPDETAAFALRTRFEEVFHRHVLPELEDVFDAHAPKGQAYRIDRLEIDLGSIDPERLDDAHIRHTIRDQLRRHLRAFRSAEIDMPSVELPLEDVFVAFLESGVLPWDSPYDSVDALERTVLTLEPEAAYPIAARIASMLEQRHIRLRLIYQFSEAFHEWLVHALHPVAWPAVLEAGRSALATMGKLEAKEVLLTALADLPRDDALTAAAFEARVLECAEAAVESPRDPDLPQDVAIEKEVPAKSAIYVHHAGIVLLHPFLERFFDHFELLDQDHRFEAEDSRARAIHLLHYLATGAEEPAEHETTLFKVLCGSSIRTPLVRRMILSPAEREEAESLLTTAIRHWGKLGNTSPQGLREGFLERQGKLTLRHSGWHLVVEQRSIDVLIQSLPWSVSVVSLPWLSNPIHVDWA